jgi:hypothetical protein
MRPPNVGRKHFKGYFVLESVGERELKNVSTLIHVYRVVPPVVYQKIA